MQSIIILLPLVLLFTSSANAANCTTTCKPFRDLLNDCTSATAGGFAECMCDSVYDAKANLTFNQATQECVTCENGAGTATDWEAYCCARRHGCNGISPQAASEAASFRNELTQTTAPHTKTIVFVNGTISIVSTSVPASTTGSGSGSVSTSTTFTTAPVTSPASATAASTSASASVSTATSRALAPGFVMNTAAVGLGQILVNMLLFL